MRSYPLIHLAINGPHFLELSYKAVTGLHLSLPHVLACLYVSISLVVDSLCSDFQLRLVILCGARSYYTNKKTCIP